MGFLLFVLGDFSQTNIGFDDVVGDLVGDCRALLTGEGDIMSRKGYVSIKRSRKCAT